MATNWINQPQKENQTSIAYNSNNQYNQLGLNYNGKLGTSWSKQIKN